MSKIQILDCTLRDGGYVNSWNFGKKVIKSIVGKLSESNIDIIECGFLTETSKGDNYSLFSSVSQIKSLVTNKKNMYVAMIAIGEKEINPEILEACDGESIDGIRLTFHKNEVDKAIVWANTIKKKGYQVFMQPVGTISYSDIEMLELVEKMNNLNPYAFYIVDTLGSMNRNELLHIYYNVDSNLKKDIKIGFHPHNNLHLAFSNAQALIRVQSKREIIIDASVYGMGRGAGNLQTELIAQYINDTSEIKYDIATVLDIYDKHIIHIREEYKWGYEIPYYISACNKCHPNYAVYLMNKQTLTMKDIEKIISLIPKEERIIYNKTLIEDLYLNYQNIKIDDRQEIKYLREWLKEKNVLILASGKTLVDEKNKIDEFIKEKNPYIISVNFVDENIEIHSCFVSNHKRIQDILVKRQNIDLIATSNLSMQKKENCRYVDYISCINSDKIVSDNAGLMLIKLLIRCNVNKVTLAGFDGYKENTDDNYYDSDLKLHMSEEDVVEKQDRFKNQLLEFGKDIEIEFLTSSFYEDK